MSNFTLPIGFENDYLQVKKQLLEFNRNKVKLWTKENDLLPLNYTINAYPLDEKFKFKLQTFVNELKKTDENLYYYPISKWHMTIIGLIPFTDQKEEIISKINGLLYSLNFKKLAFRVCGCSSNDKVTSVQCYPINFNVLEFRSKIRESLGIEGKSYSEYLNVFERICWINLVRYPLIPSESFERELKSFFEIDFGNCNFGLHLRQNASSTLSDNEISKSEVIHTFI